MQETCANPLAEFRDVNVRGGAMLAQAAAWGGVRRFIYLSSIEVLGESTPPGQPFSAEFPLSPGFLVHFQVGRGCSGANCGRQWDRTGDYPPPGLWLRGKVDFQALIRRVARGIPLPFGRVHGNRRSLVYLGNQVDLIACCVTYPGAPVPCFLVSDGDNLSTARLLGNLQVDMDLTCRQLECSPPYTVTDGMAAMVSS